MQFNLCKAKPYSRSGSALSQLEAPFSEAKVTAFYKVVESCGHRSVHTEDECAAFDCRFDLQPARKLAIPYFITVVKNRSLQRFCNIKGGRKLHRR